MKKIYIEVGMHSYIDTISVYLKPQVFVIFLLGFASGLPLALSGSTLVIWMKTANIDLGTIGLFSLVGLPYSLKFFWAPVVDAFRVPYLSRIFGRRRAWLLLSQLFLILSIIYLGSLDPVNAPWFVAFGALIVAVISATQDIIIDAYRVEVLPEDEQAAGVAYYVSAYRVAMLVSTAGVIAVVVYLRDKGITPLDAWFYGYCFAAVLIVIGMIGVLLGKEPAEVETQDNSHSSNGNMVVKFYQTAWKAFSEFLKKPNIIVILLFVVLFKLCDALAGVMTGPFVLDIGFNEIDYATVVKGVGLAATLAGTFLAGLIAYSMNMYFSLWLAVLLQILSNLTFIWQFYVGVEYWALVITIIVENFTGAIGTIIFIAYLSSLCGNTIHTATQYALLTALASVGRTTLSASSGYIAQETGWPVFFGITILAGIPVVFILFLLRSKREL